MMVFAFMLLSAEQKMASLAGQKAPQQHETVARESLKMVSENQIGRLVKRGGQLWLVFEDKYYHPQKDIHTLAEDRRLTVRTTGTRGTSSKVLFIEEVRKDAVLLGEYLRAFQHLSQKGIQVAFVKRLT
jgi:hypothetical protein